MKPTTLLGAGGVPVSIILCRFDKFVRYTETHSTLVGQAGLRGLHL